MIVKRRSFQECEGFVLKVFFSALSSATGQEIRPIHFATKLLRHCTQIE